jgi:hypothetical protein
MEIETGIEPPLKNKWTTRITQEVKSMSVGQSFVGDKATVGAFRSFAYYRKWKAQVRKLADGNFRAWRIT